MFDNHPLQIGDRVIDDNGEYGYVYRHGSMTTQPDGTVSVWSAHIRYGYNQESYGKTRCVTNGEVSKILDDGSLVDL